MMKKRFPERMHASRIPDALKQILMLFLFLGAGCVVVLIMWYAYFDAISVDAEESVPPAQLVPYGDTLGYFDELPSGLDMGEDFIVTMAEGATDIARIYTEEA